MAPPAAVEYQIQDIKAASTYQKANDVYLHFNVQKQPGVKTKTSVLPHDNETYTWLDEILTLEVHEPVDAVLEVAAYSKRTIVPDHSIGEYTIVLPAPGASETFQGKLTSKNGEENGTVKFTVSSTLPGGGTGMQKSAGVGQPTTTGQQRHDASMAQGDLASVGGQARANTDLVAQEAARRTDTTSAAARGKTSDTVDAAAQRLQNVKADLSAGTHNPQSFEQPTATQGQSAYSKKIGVPPEAGTAADAPGTGTANNAPYDAASGGAVGSITGPVAPTGQGGVLSGTGASATGPSTGGAGAAFKNAAYTAADKAQSALLSAKQQFSGGAPNQP